MSEIRFVRLEPRSRASPEQFAALLEFMESHGDLTRPQQGMLGRLKSDRLWQELGDLLNAIGGGVVKSIDKWKKVWIDWKAKTKKKALLKHAQVCGTGGGPSSKSAITAPEHRVLGIMGLNTVAEDSMIEEAGFDEPLPSPRTQSSVPNKFPSVNKEGFLDFPLVIEGNLEPLAITPPTSFQNTLPPPPQVPTPPPQALPRRRPSSPSPVPSPTTSTRRQRRLRRIQTPFNRATAKFIDIEKRRLELEEIKEKNSHERELERLRLDSRRLDLDLRRLDLDSRRLDLDSRRLDMDSRRLDLDSRRLDQEQANVEANNRVHCVLTEILAHLRPS